MTSQGTAHGRFTRALATRNLFQAELALREMGTPSLLVLVDYLELLAEVKPEMLDPLDLGMGRNTSQSTNSVGTADGRGGSRPEARRKEVQ